VFHPGFFFSTKMLIRYLDQQPIEGKDLLELGAGSGLISIYAAKRAARVVATDISATAISCIINNAERNEVALEVMKSDLFKNIPRRVFDHVVINPPYYKKAVTSEADLSWYCGENGEYFQNLFMDLKYYVHDRSDVWMVLCEGCDLGMINLIAAKNNFRMDCVQTKRTIIEDNYIFKIEQV
jgi:release factor glutamine methyltransferase